MYGVGPGESRERNLEWLDWSIPFDISSDGKLVLFDETGEGGGANYGVYVRSTDGSPPVHLGEGMGQALSPDQQWVAGTVHSQPTTVVLWPVGAGEVRRISTNITLAVGMTFLPDGKHLVVSGAQPGHASRVYVADLNSVSVRAISPEGYVSPGGHAVSPDAKYVLAVDPAQRTVLVPMDGGEPQVISGVPAGETPIGWTADGKSFFVQESRGVPIRIDLVDVATGRVKPWKTITPPDMAGVVGASITVAPNGKYYAYSVASFLDTLYEVDGLH
jgi:Tol biopolymer transport system component